MKANTSTPSQYSAEQAHGLLHILSQRFVTSQSVYTFQHAILQGAPELHQIQKRSQHQFLVNFAAMLKNICQRALVAINASRAPMQVELVAQMCKACAHFVQAGDVSRKTCDFVTIVHGVFLSCYAYLIAYMRHYSKRYFS